MSGVIYKIVTGNEVYVGSTFNYELRVNDHKSNIYNEKSNNYTMKVYKTIRDNDGEWEISIYEDNLSMTKDELRIREEEVRLLLGATLNSMRAYRTYEQMREAKNAAVSKWAINNKEKLVEKGKLYYNKNKEVISVKSKTLIKCECGLMITRGAMSKHKKSAKHARLMISPELP